MSHDVREYYATHPLMVSSPFGGVTGVNRDLLGEVRAALHLDFARRSVLDVGCGRGFLAEIVAEEGGDYTGVDLVASRRGFRLALADGAALPFREGTFDAICCVDAFEHFPDPMRAASEFRRVLRPGGFVFLSVPNYANVAGLVKKACERWGRYERDTWAPFRQWRPQALETFMTSRRVRAVFSAAGFTHFGQHAHGAETALGLFPWIEHAKMPEAIRFRAQRVFARIGPAVARIWPDASLHHFWRIEG